MHTFELIFPDFHPDYEFAMWAFGVWPVFYDEETMHRWNDRHHDLFLLHPEGEIKEDIMKMKKFYHEHLKRELAKMDEQIRKVRSDVDKGDKKKAKKDISKLLKMDKKFDKKIAAAEKMKKEKKKR